MVCPYFFQKGRTERVCKGRACYVSICVGRKGTRLEFAAGVDMNKSTPCRQTSAEKLFISFICCAGLMSVHGTDFALSHRWG
jgi:hypothetical protein